ncbi:MAG: TetR/AcrR family transcriptional regulator [Syntrophaceae bacterium]|nr:TetR/AcrR family transcriptional regulator [Syntrophaceae bacterium]
MDLPVREKRKISDGRPSLTRKGLATRGAILEAAHRVFKDMGYYGSSISEIARRCGVSMGNFYQYFKNKEQVFLELSDLILSQFMVKAEFLASTQGAFEKRLEEAIRLLYEHTRENFAFHRILGESELTDRVTIAYYEAMARHYRDFFRREAQAGNLRPLDPNMISYGLIGICYFHSLDWGEREKISSRESIRQMADLILHGINGPARWKKRSAGPSLSLPPPVALHSSEGEPLTKGESTRQAIFRAAEKVIGRLGGNRANISEITREAGVALGTFYVHFGSKRELIEGLVKYVNSQMRRELQRRVSQNQDRRDAERVGMIAFYEFLRKHREVYRVVPECEMIDREVSLWYYKKVADGYIQGLQRGMEKGEIRKLPPVFLARSLMGLIHFIGLKWIVWNTSAQPEVPDHILKDMITLILFGLKP